MFFAHNQHSPSILLAKLYNKSLFKGRKKSTPRKPKRLCSYQDCPDLCEEIFCKKHKKEENGRQEKYERPYDAHKRYGRAWQKVRDSYVKEHPFCELCFKKKLMVAVEEVHHIKSIAEGGTHAKNNLISLCKSCHSHIQAKRGDR